MPKHETSIQELTAAVANLQQQLGQILSVQQQRVSRGTRKRRLARGTPGDAPQVASSPEAPPMELPDRIVHHLRGSWDGSGGGERRPMTAEQIAEAVDDALPAVRDALSKLEAAKQVTHLSKGGDLRLWVWRPGPDAGHPERRATVVGLLMEEPLGNGDLIRITGAKAKQIENDLVEIRRKEPVWWMNKGVGGHLNLYWIRADRKPPPSDLDGRLAPKYIPKR